MELLKRRYKSKLRKGYTHSLGLKIISECLHPCKHYSDINLVCSDETDHRLGVYVPGWFDGRKLKGYSKDLLSFQCLIAINYSEPLDEWGMKLYPVELDKTKRSKSILLRIALPEIKKWLDAIEAETWYAGRRYLQIGIDYKTKKYCIFETQDDRIIEKRIENIYAK
jgi:hypothetical protein